MESKFNYSFSARGLVLIALLLIFVLSGFAPLQQEEPGGTILDDILALITRFASLAGVSALVAAITGFARRMGWISTDDQLGKVASVINLIAFVVLVAVGVFRPDLDINFLDGLAAQLAIIALFVLGLIVQILTPAPLFRAAYAARVPGFQQIGERQELRARGHVINENPPVENWTAESAEVTEAARRRRPPQ